MPFYGVITDISIATLHFLQTTGTSTHRDRSSEAHHFQRLLYSVDQRQFLRQFPPLLLVFLLFQIHGERALTTLREQGI